MMISHKERLKLFEHVIWRAVEKVLACLIIISVIFHVRARLRFGLIVVFNELLMILIVCVPLVFFLWFGQKRRQTLMLNELQIGLYDYPSVDVLIVCCGEPVNILRATLEHAIRIEYPKDKQCIYLCDDKASHEARDLVIELQKKNKWCRIQYVARRKVPGVPCNFKAGNINHSLFNEKSSGDLILVIDADMQCDPLILQKMVPHFFTYTSPRIEVINMMDPDVAMVQSPQGFYNLFEHEEAFGQSQAGFYGPYSKCWDQADSVPCSGSNVLFTRESLSKVGGMQTDSLCEDFLTSMILKDAGFKTKYVHEVLAWGLAPETVRAYHKQQFRWATGDLQILFRHFPLLKPGLSWKAKLLYTCHFTHIFSFLGTFVMAILVPLQLLVYGKNVQPDPEAFVFPTALVIGFFVVYRETGIPHILRLLRQSLLLMPVKLSALFHFLFSCKEAGWMASGSVSSNDCWKDVKPAITHIIFVIYWVGCVIYGLICYKEQVPISLFVSTLTMIWMMWPFVRAVLPAWKSWKSPYQVVAKPVK